MALPKFFPRLFSHKRACSQARLHHTSRCNLGPISGHGKPLYQLLDDVGPAPGGGGVLPRILDRGVPRRFVNPNPI